MSEPEAVALDDHGVAVVEEPVEHGGGDHLVAKNVAPLGDHLIGGDEHAASLVTAGDELEEEIRGLLLEGQVAELVDDQDFFAKHQK